MALNAHATAFSLDNAKVLGQAAAVSYDSAQVCETWAKAQGFTGTFDFIDVADTQGFVAQNDEAILVAFRGTQPNRRVDWMSDAEASHVSWAHDVGKVHKGFYHALDVVWRSDKQILPRRLVDRGNRTVWITGHSLGGALAEMCAARLTFDPAIVSVPVQGVYTFGQPRVGDDRFAALLHEALGARIFRFVNDRDIVPRVPLFGMGYRHYGCQTFYDHAGTGTDSISAVETLAVALKFAERALSAEPLALAAGLVGDIFKNVAHGQFDNDEIARARFQAILESGIENVSDHDMRKCYLSRLGATLT